MAQTPQNLEDVMKVYKALVVDLPLAGTRWALGLGTDKKTAQTMWTGYDAGVRLATAAVDSLYRSQSLSEIVGTSVNQMFRWQQLGSTLTNAVTTSVWKSLGLPTATEVRTLRDHVHTLEVQLHEETLPRSPQLHLHRNQSARHIPEPGRDRTEAFGQQEARAAA
ncbi:MAG: hypothetical protein AB7G75_24475 [Candidatus Binatia bacterium]